MRLIDTHCHLTDPAFDGDREAMMDRMRAAGVSRALVIESDLDRLERTLAWCRTIPDIGLATGCHPHDASRWNDDLASHLHHVWSDPAVRAAGEMGLDYHYDHAPRDVQRQVFSAQLALAVGAGQPVVVHAREADADVAAILAEQPAGRIVLHSFSSTDLLADAGLAAGWYFSFSGMVTFRSWDRSELVRRIPLERLLIETDAPYLAPVPQRGKRNEPAFVAHTVRRLAEMRGLPVNEMAEITAANAAALFWQEAPPAR